MGKIRNPVSFSEHFRIPASKLAALGVFNPVLNVDTKLFIDPVLLSKSRHRSFAGAATATFRAHFEAIIKLLTVTKTRGDVAWREADRRLKFPEIAATCLGYGAGTIHGTAIGPSLRGRLLSTAKEVVDLGVTDPDLFILLPLLEDGVGADRISDLTTNVIAEDLARFSEFICESLGIETSRFRVGRTEFSLPRNPTQDGMPVLLTPSDLLKALPVASDWSEVADAVANTDALRSRVNRLIGHIWSARVRKRRDVLRRRVLASREAFEVVLEAVRRGSVRPYDMERDPDGLATWRSVHQTVARQHPLSLLLDGPPDAGKAIALVDQIVEHFGTLIERKGLWKLLWHDGKPHAERVAQMVFFAVADAYCKANKLDVTPEADTGNGPVDFKFSAGYDVRVLVEIKLSSNTSLLPGYEKQLKAYEESQEPISSTYLVIDVGGLGETKRRALVGAHAGARRVRVVFVDGRPRPSASKR